MGSEFNDYLETNTTAIYRLKCAYSISLNKNFSMKVLGVLVKTSINTKIMIIVINLNGVSGFLGLDGYIL